MIVERWSIRMEFDSEADVDTAAGQRALSAAASVLEHLNTEHDLWPDRIEVQREVSP